MQKFVTLLLDQSGSMASVLDDTIGGFNTYVQGLQQSDPDAHFTFLLFDSNGVEVRHRAIPVTGVPMLDRSTYKPGAMTPLVDATMKAIAATEEKAGGAHAVVVVIQTDGLENASREFTFADLAEKVKKKTADGWLFLFLGANMDAFQQGMAGGFVPDSTMSYNAKNAAANAAAFQATLRATRSYTRAGGGAAGQSVGSYTMEEKTSAGIDLPDDWKGPKAQAQQPPVTAAKRPIIDDITI